MLTETILDGAFDVAGALIGGIKANETRRKMRRDIRGQLAENKAWHTRAMNEDATQRADAQRLIARTEEMLRQRSRAAAARQAVAGATDESVAVEKEAAGNAAAGVAAQIAASADTRKDTIDRQFRDRQSRLREMLLSLH